jgi:hypothetical protein
MATAELSVESVLCQSEETDGDDDPVPASVFGHFPSLPPTPAPLGIAYVRPTLALPRALSTPRPPPAPKPPKPPRPTCVPPEVLDQACAQYGVPATAILSPERGSRTVMDARLAVYLALRALKWTSPDISRVVGGRDASGVRDALKRYDLGVHGERVGGSAEGPRDH